MHWLTILWRRLTHNHRDRARAVILLSERKKSEAAREEAAVLRSVSALAAAAAHEINNPLAVVVAQAGLLVHEVSAPARGRLDAIRDAAGRIAIVVTEMSHIEPPSKSAPR